MRARFLLLSLLVAWPALMLPANAQRPPQPNQVVTRIAFGSCADQERSQRIWSVIRDYRPELFIFTGDNVYGDHADGKAVTDDDRLMDTLKAAYAKADANEQFARLRRDIPHLATWDDHDYGKNDSGADFVHRAASQAQFVEFWKLPASDPRRSRPGVYHAETFGPPGKRVQVILLDTRYFRSPLKRGEKGYVPDDSPDKTMLGQEQWNWLEAQLKEPADLRLIVSSIQLVAEGHTFERWGNFPRERQRFYDLLRKTGANSAIVLSGDRHIGAIYKQVEGVPYPLYDITSSGLTHSYTGAKETSPNRIGALYGAVHFGTIDIDWWDQQIRLSIRSGNGEPVRSVSIPFAEIAAPKP